MTSAVSFFLFIYNVRLGKYQEIAYIAHISNEILAVREHLFDVLQTLDILSTPQGIYWLVGDEGELRTFTDNSFRFDIANYKNLLRQHLPWLSVFISVYSYYYNFDNNIMPDNDAITYNMESIINSLDYIRIVLDNGSVLTRNLSEHLNSL